MRARERLEPHVALAIPPAQAVADSLDKVRTLDVARRVPDAFAVPQTLAPGAPSDVDPADVATWPVLVKPRSADGARGIHLVTDAAQLRPVYDAVHRLYPRPLIQERMRYGPGDKYQLYYLFDGAGRLAAQFMQRILHEARGITGPEGTWQRGGISLQWESSHDADMLARGQRLLEAMEWRGTAFVEVVRDRRDGRLKLLEINPRLSGSIHLCLACGPQSRGRRLPGGTGPACPSPARIPGRPASAPRLDPHAAGRRVAGIVRPALPAAEQAPRGPAALCRRVRRSVEPGCRAGSRSSPGPWSRRWLRSGGSGRESLPHRWSCRRSSARPRSRCAGDRHLRARRR